LEEPPGATVLILTATEADALLDTIKSRCRVVGIRPIATAKIQQALVTHWNVPSEQAHLLAHLANGRLGWAVTASQNPERIHQRLDQLTLLHDILGSNIVERFKLAEKLAKQPDRLVDLLNTWLTWWRDLLLLAHGTDSVINIDERITLEQLKTEWEVDNIRVCLNQTKAILWQLDRNVNIRLALENLFLNYPQATVRNLAANE
jgi:DNA polymerase-3 subunit delta'